MEEEIYQQMSLWDYVYPKKVIDKPIRLIEFFAGIGAQHKALKQLTDQVESWKICEWAYNSYCSYNAIHIKDFKDYSQGLSKEELIEKVRGTSTNYNEPLTDKQLKAKPIEWLRNAYNNIKATHNLINIMEVHGKDLEIVDTDKYEYIMTYSFPCQDLSLAGKRGGMDVSQAEGGTRSGLLWEVDRILDELVRGGLSLPNVLIMENVPEVIGQANYDNYAKWELKLTQLGYSNFVRILNATDYGIPQSRRRCFMISILGDYNYNSPMKLELKYKLKDFLEKEVDESFFLTPKMYDHCIGKNQKPSKFPRKERFLQSLKNTNEKGIATTITTTAGQRPTDNFIVCNSYNNKRLNETLKNKTIEEGDFIDSYNRSISKGISGTITTRISAANNTYVVGKTLKENNILPTLDTRCDCLGVVVQEPKVVGGIGEKKSNGGTQWYEQDRIYDDNIATAISANHSFHPNYATNLGIRKLTPKECFRLMGFEDDDYTACDSVGLSKSAIYHMAGDSIVVTVLIGIFSQLMEEDKHKKVIPEYIKKGIIEK